MNTQKHPVLEAWLRYADAPFLARFALVFLGVSLTASILYGFLSGMPFAPLFGAAYAASRFLLFLPLRLLFRSEKAEKTLRKVYFGPDLLLLGIFLVAALCFHSKAACLATPSKLLLFAGIAAGYLVMDSLLQLILSHLGVHQPEKEKPSSSVPSPN